MVEDILIAICVAAFGVIAYFIKRLHDKIEEASTVPQVLRMIDNKTKILEVKNDHLKERVDHLESELKEDLMQVSRKLDRLIDMHVHRNNRRDQ